MHKDGREFPVGISLSPLETEQGVVFTSAIRDISQRKAAENAARELSARLLQMQDEEHRRIARELHDSAGQVIAALTSVVTSKPANGGHGKTGQRRWPGTRLFYSAESSACKFVFVRQLRGPHLSTCP